MLNAGACMRGARLPAHIPERLLTFKRSQDGLVCPLCITPLDVMESGWVPCPCGYQLCLFCYERIRNEFNNQCMDVVRVGLRN